MLLLTQIDETAMLMSTPSYGLIGNPGAKSPGSKLDDEELFILEGSKKLALNSGTPGGARKMTQNASKSPFTAAIPPSRVPFSAAQLNVHQLWR